MPRWSVRGMLVLVALVALAIPSLQYASEAWLALVVGITIVAFLVALNVAVVDRGPRQAFAIGFVLTMAAYGLILMSFQTREFDQWKGRLPTTRLLRYVHAAVDRSEWTPAVAVLQRGATGELVEVLQRMLNARATPSPPLQIDGDFGPRTASAAKLFQMQVGLAATGAIDMETWQSLGLKFDSRSRRIVIPVYARSKPTTLNVSGGGFALVGGGSFREIPPREIFMPIGHCWWGLLLGYVGGFLATFIYWRRVRERQPLATDSP